MTLSTSRRRTLAGLGALAVLPAARNARAQAFPAKPIKLIVPHAAGGNSDAFGRILAQRLSDRIGQQVVVENRPGAGGNISLGALAREPADGHTIGITTSTSVWGGRTLYRNLPFNPDRDFVPLG